MINKGLFTSKKPNWKTPKWLFDLLDNQFGFDCDICADDQNALCDNYFTEKNSCLFADWHYTNFMNPPYGRDIINFVSKAHHQYDMLGNRTIGLLPARTDTKWFHNYIYKQAPIIFIKGRLKFEGGDKLAPAPFPSMIVGWGFTEKEFLTMEDKLYKGKNEK
jgi:phage N-6-adenine-methyltransferase